VTTRNIDISIGEYYHLYSRGVDRRAIFIDDNDRDRFVRLLYLCNGLKPVVYKTVQAFPLEEIDIGESLVAIGAYCLMPNHFHLLIKETTDGGVVKFMSKLLTAYSSYFNRKHERTGALFGSEFKASHIDNDEYLKYIFSYIHLNPAKLLDPEWRVHGGDKTGLYDFTSKYNYSSFYEYSGKERESSVILNRPEFPEYFNTPLSFRDFVWEWLKFNDE